VVVFIYSTQSVSLQRTRLRIRYYMRSNSSKLVRIEPVKSKAENFRVH